LIGQIKKQSLNNEKNILIPRIVLCMFCSVFTRNRRNRRVNTVIANIRSNSNGTWDTVYGMGLAPGAKFSLGKNWFGEISLGAGLLFGNSYSEGEKTAMYYRFGISFGKQF